MKKNEAKKPEKPSIVADRPLLTIIMPVRNCAGAVLRMLQEIEGQCIAAKQNAPTDALRVLAIDDASEDETTRFLADWCKAHPRVSMMRNDKRLGAGGCRNVGAKFALEKLESEYIAFFDADDFLMPDAIGQILTACAERKADCIQWGFSTLNRDPSRDRAWMPKYQSPDQWVTCPVAPWLHAIRPYLFQQFPEQLTTDDTIWWFRQAEVLQDCGAKFFFIHAPLYVYDRRTGGCTRASDYFDAHATTLETAAVEDTCIRNGFPDRYISDCLRNLAEMYDMRNSLSGGVLRQFLIRFRRDVASCWAGHWGW